jgi:hypothetical protein
MALSMQPVCGFRDLAPLIAGALELVRSRRARATAACDRGGTVRRAPGRPKHPLRLGEHRCISYSYAMTTETWRFTKREIGDRAAVRPAAREQW